MEGLSKGRSKSKRARQSIFAWLTVIIIAIVAAVLVRGVFRIGSAKAEPIAVINETSEDASATGQGDDDLVPQAALGADESLWASESRGTEVSATNFRLEGNKVSADVCFTMPDDGDWTIRRAALQYGGVEIKEYGWSFQGTTSARGVGASVRCDEVYFYIPEGDNPNGIVMRIDAIAAFPREGEACTGAYLARAQAVIDSKGQEIVLGCVLEEAGEGIVEGLTVVSWPADMSRAQAEAAVGGIDFLIDVHGIRGPWVFEATLR